MLKVNSLYCHVRFKCICVLPSLNDFFWMTDGAAKDANSLSSDCVFAICSPHYLKITSKLVLTKYSRISIMVSFSELAL